MSSHNQSPWQVESGEQNLRWKYRTAAHAGEVSGISAMVKQEASQVIVQPALKQYGGTEAVNKWICGNMKKSKKEKGLQK